MQQPALYPDLDTPQPAAAATDNVDLSGKQTPPRVMKPWDHAWEKISGFLPRKVQSNPKPFFLRLVQVILAIIVFGAISDAVNTEINDEAACFYGIEGVGELKGDLDACKYGMGIGVMGFLVSLFLVVCTVIPFGIPPILFLGEFVLSTILTILWFCGGAYLSASIRTTCQNLTCADPSSVSGGAYDEDSFNNAGAAILFSWVSFILWTVSSYWAFQIWINGGSLEKNINEYESTKLATSIASLVEKSKVILPAKVRNYPRPYVLRVIEVLASIIVFGCISDALVGEFAGKDYCYFGLDNDSTEGVMSMCNYGIAVGVIGFLVSLFSTLAMVFWDGNHFVRIIETAFNGIWAFLWFVAGCLFAEQMRVTCGYFSCATTESNVFGKNAYDNAEAVILFSWLSFFLWTASTYDAYLLWYNGGFSHMTDINESLKPEGTTSSAPAPAAQASGAYTPPPVPTPGASNMV